MGLSSRAYNYPQSLNLLTLHYTWLFNLVFLDLTGQTADQNPYACAQVNFDMMCVVLFISMVWLIQ